MLNIQYLSRKEISGEVWLPFSKIAWRDNFSNIAQMDFSINIYVRAELARTLSTRLRCVFIIHVGNMRLLSLIRMWDCSCRTHTRASKYYGSYLDHLRCLFWIHLDWWPFLGWSPSSMKHHNKFISIPPSIFLSLSRWLSWFEEITIFETLYMN